MLARWGWKTKGLVHTKIRHFWVQCISKPFEDGPHCFCLILCWCFTPGLSCCQSCSDLISKLLWYPSALPLCALLYPCHTRMKHKLMPQQSWLSVQCLLAAMSHWTGQELATCNSGCYSPWEIRIQLGEGTELSRYAFTTSEGEMLLYVRCSARTREPKLSHSFSRLYSTLQFTLTAAPNSKHHNRKPGIAT